jgi:hypothetical protein
MEILVEMVVQPVANWIGFELVCYRSSAEGCHFTSLKCVFLNQIQFGAPEGIEHFGLWM